MDAYGTMSHTLMECIAMTVKFSREVIDGSTRWVHEGTKHLPKCFAYNSSRNRWALLNYETSRFISDGFTSKAEVGEFILGYDAMHEEEQARAEQERLDREEEMRVRFETEQKYQSMFTSDFPETFSVAVGERIYAKFPILNKCGTVGEYALRADAPQYDEDEVFQGGRWESVPNWRIELCSVEKVLTLTKEQYDRFAENLMTDGFLDIGNGGTDSDSSHRVSTIAEFHALSEEQQADWKAKSFRLVTVIQAPERRAYVVDAQGYTHARYVGLHPTKIQ